MAPFKLRFSKMSKSRSNESKSSSTECDEPLGQTQEGLRSHAGTPRSEINQVAIGNNLQENFSHSPPPSYEHVLQETRLRQSTSGAGENKPDNEEGISKSSISQNRLVERRGPNREIPKGPEILHKSSKELYRAVAKQWGITCKMSDQCRCFDCQSHYFDCEYERDEQGKTDGGLGAGTPMFIAEVMHGTACVLL